MAFSPLSLPVHLTFIAFCYGTSFAFGVTYLSEIRRQSAANLQTFYPSEASPTAQHATLSAIVLHGLLGLLLFMKAFVTRFAEECKTNILIKVVLTWHYLYILFTVNGKWLAYSTLNDVRATDDWIYTCLTLYMVFTNLLVSYLWHWNPMSNK
jgi:hypothetical protein